MSVMDAKIVTERYLQDARQIVRREYEAPNGRELPAETTSARLLESVIDEAFALWRVLLGTGDEPIGGAGDGGELARRQALRLLNAAEEFLVTTGCPAGNGRKRSAEVNQGVTGSSTVSPAALSRREVEVLRLLAAGQSDREVAATLGVSHRTATTHVATILKKLGVPTRTAAVARAIRASLV
jgi:DNA-binding CsgD family transcriptional regulator